MNATAGPAAARWLDIGDERTALRLVVILTVVRFAIAPFVPLAFDEAYYWRWSEHLALGYFDHPPLIAWMIRLGTTIFGDTVLGVRLFPLLGGVAASWAVWQAALALYDDRRLAATATVYFSLMLIVAVGTILATPDAPLLVASAFLLLCLSKAAKTGEPAWWLAAGLATGLGCLSKYTALFWLPSILLWLLLDPKMRKTLATPWPWLGAAFAILIFLPNLLWNVGHGWLTFDKQFGRVAAEDFTPQYVLEHLLTEIGMATPVIFVLAWLGMGAYLRRRGGTQTTRILLSALVWPTTLYFIYHSFHERVEGNWTGPIFPALAIAAAACLAIDWRGRWATVVAALRPFAVPVGLVFVFAIYAQTLLGWLPLGTWDPTASRIGAGMEAVTAEIEAIREEEGATVIFTPNYALTGWLSFYAPRRPAPVVQLDEPERWLQEPRPTPDMMEGPYILVLPSGASAAAVEAALGPTERIASIERRRGPLLVETYDIYRIRPRALAGL